MSFKEKLPKICEIFVPSLIAGICTGVAFHKGYNLGHKNGCNFGRKLGYLEAELDATLGDIKAHKESGKKEEASE